MKTEILQTKPVKAAVGDLNVTINPPLSERKVRFADRSKVRADGEAVNKEFASAFRILAK